MEQSDYERVVADMRLANGLPWSIPITLSVEFAIASSGRQLDTPRPYRSVCRRFASDPKISLRQDFEAINVYRTDDAKHPGVQVVYNQGQ